MKTKCWIAVALAAVALPAQAKSYRVQSPDREITVTISDGKDLSYTVSDRQGTVIAPSEIALTLSDGSLWGKNAKVKKTSTRKVSETLPASFYKTKSVENKYNELTLHCGDFSVEFRAFNDGVAYRFVSNKKGVYEIATEKANFCFDNDYTATVPYVRTDKPETFERQFFNSFENTYTQAPLSQLAADKLIFLPIVVSLDSNRKVCITEVNLESYPGMFLNNPDAQQGLCGVFAPSPKTVEQGGYNALQLLVKERDAFIAKCDGPRSFPWRAIAISQSDKELANSNLVYKLADDCRIAEIDWIRPGKVAWEWWNNLNITGVDFAAGVNNDTYKHYIDFAAENGIEYVILDEGWAVNLAADLFQVVPEINLEELVSYGKQKKVGLILWAGYYAFARDLEKVCEHYARLGIKGFKVDFMDRDDQLISEFLYQAAEVCARHKLLLDYHGIHKPTGLNRTYPNVVNYEGVFGMEQLKWSSPDMPQNDVYLPFIRMVAGPMDYTQGAMLNASSWEFRPSFGLPMSQGTRCHQLAQYIIFESPLNMLCDSPEHYRANPACTKFIAEIPTVWDETVVLDGKMGEYIVTARRIGDCWYVGGSTNWTARELVLDLSFLEGDDFEIELFRDGANVHRNATDYKQEKRPLPSNKKLPIRLAEGGGFAAKIIRK